ncbi:hypothetical protein [Actinomyces sp. MRS3W]|uniref:hypothetical protein n=1 Tax=Actinomyces sp. MRS3W TaxID=2800796 RepID=UPI0028FDA4FF|nr:hypothetical protein [Actinomyces sp. MRS3W]MDU0348341.1 hypothetical protein [Actinomyces sp. MRS3W]
MASDFSGSADDVDPRIGSEPVAAERARDMLASLDGDRRNLAERMVVPAWYYPVFAGVVASMTFFFSVPSWPHFLYLLHLMAILFLGAWYRARCGINVQASVGRRSNALLALMMGVAAFAMVASFFLGRYVQGVGWVLLVVAVEFVAVIVLGVRYDAALRQEIAQGK